MTQRLLFEKRIRAVRVPYRAADPKTSKDAAEAVAKSRGPGGRTAQCRAVLDALLERPGSTSRELAEWSGIDRYVIARRLPELRDAGFVAQGEPRVCRSGHRSAVTWAVTDEGRRLG